MKFVYLTVDKSLEDAMNNEIDLDMYGIIGWELITILQIKNNVKYVFKRKID